MEFNISKCMILQVRAGLKNRQTRQLPRAAKLEGPRVLSEQIKQCLTGIIGTGMCIYDTLYMKLII